MYTISLDMPQSHDNKCCDWLKPEHTNKTSVDTTILHSQKPCQMHNFHIFAGKSLQQSHFHCFTLLFYKRAELKRDKIPKRWYFFLCFWVPNNDKFHKCTQLLSEIIGVHQQWVFSSIHQIFHSTESSSVQRNQRTQTADSVFLKEKINYFRKT